MAIAGVVARQYRLEIFTSMRATSHCARHDCKRRLIVLDAKAHFSLTLCKKSIFYLQCAAGEDCRQGAVSVHCANFLAAARFPGVTACRPQGHL